MFLRIALIAALGLLFPLFSCQQAEKQPKDSLEEAMDKAAADLSRRWKPLEGQYLLENNDFADTLSIYQPQPGFLMGRPSGKSAIPLVEEYPLRFGANLVGASIQFFPDEDRRVSRLLLIFQGDSIYGNRVR
jgi:hypothetical protein